MGVSVLLKSCAIPLAICPIALRALLLNDLLLRSSEFAERLLQFGVGRAQFLFGSTPECRFCTEPATISSTGFDRRSAMK